MDNVVALFPLDAPMALSREEDELEVRVAKLALRLQRADAVTQAAICRVLEPLLAR